MNSSTEEIYQKLLDSGIPKEQLKKAIQKKAKEYSGYISKKGVLFLIAKDLGIEIRDPATDLKFYEEIERKIDYDELTVPIEKVKEGMVNIVLLGKIIAIYPQRGFSRKDGSQGLVNSFVIGDETGEIKINVWDEKAAPLQNNTLKGSLVRVIGDYAKSNRDGEIEVHISKKGKLILAPEVMNFQTKQKLINIKPSENISEKGTSQVPLNIEDLMERYKFIKAIQGKVHIEEFKEITKKNGEKTFLLKLLLSDNSSSVVVNIWGMKAISVLKNIDEGYYIRIRNVAARVNNYTNQKELYYTKISALKII
ncbi:MAG: hypothetical protein ACFFBH_10255 [Promethearchaeota archaeon]